METKIFELIPKVMADIGAISKDRSNEQQKYKFRGIEDFYQAAHPAMIKHGVFCAPEVLERDEYRFEKTNDYGKTNVWLHVTMKVRHRFYAGDGSFVDVITCGEGLDNSDKASNKAMSGAMKYALIELFCVPTKDVEDSDSASPEQGKKKTVIERPVNVPATVTTSSNTVVTVTPQPGDENPFALEDPYITSAQAGVIARRFRESLKEELRPLAEELRHNALAYFKMIDKDGNPSALMIKSKDYVTMGKKLVDYARGLN